MAAMPSDILSKADHRRIADAIRAAETATSGEIYCVVARQSDSYIFPTAFGVAMAALAASLAIAVWLETGWHSPGLVVFVAAQILGTASAVAMVRLMPRLRLAMVPHRLKYRRAHDNARRQFLARNVHVTTERTGVLIFVSLAERYAEVVADAGIAEKVPQAVWDDIVAGLIAASAEGQLADGFVEAVRKAGDVLATHFPRGSGDRNELDDHLVEI